MGGGGGRGEGKSDNKDCFHSQKMTRLPNKFGWNPDVNTQRKELSLRHLVMQQRWKTVLTKFWNEFSDERKFLNKNDDKLFTKFAKKSFFVLDFSALLFFGKLFSTISRRWQTNILLILSMLKIEIHNFFKFWFILWIEMRI